MGQWLMWEIPPARKKHAERQRQREEKEGKGGGTGGKILKDKNRDLCRKAKISMKRFIKG